MAVEGSELGIKICPTVKNMYDHAAKIFEELASQKKNDAHTSAIDDDEEGSPQMSLSPMIRDLISARIGSSFKSSSTSSPVQEEQSFSWRASLRLAFDFGSIMALAACFLALDFLRALPRIVLRRDIRVQGGLSAPSMSNPLMKARVAMEKNSSNLQRKLVGEGTPKTKCRGPPSPERSPEPNQSPAAQPIVSRQVKEAGHSAAELAAIESALESAIRVASKEAIEADEVVVKSEIDAAIHTTKDEVLKDGEKVDPVVSAAEEGPAERPVKPSPSSAVIQAHPLATEPPSTYAEETSEPTPPVAGAYAPKNKKRRGGRKKRLGGRDGEAKASAPPNGSSSPREGAI